MKTEIKKELGICGLHLKINIHEINVLNDAKSALEKGLELRKASKDADDEYSRARWSSQLSEEEKQALAKKGTEAEKAVEAHQQREMAAVEVLFGFVTKMLEDYPQTEKCGFEPRKFTI